MVRSCAPRCMPGAVGAGRSLGWFYAAPGSPVLGPLPDDGLRDGALVPAGALMPLAPGAPSCFCAKPVVADAAASASAATEIINVCLIVSFLSRCVGPRVSTGMLGNVERGPAV